MKKKFLVTIGMIVMLLGYRSSINAQTQIITTIAGNGTWGYSGDSNPARTAQLNGNKGITVDALGNVFVADYNNNVIRKISASGIITTVAGNGTAGYAGNGGIATAAQLYQPTSVAVDGTGNIYISDNGNHVIRKVDISGVITNFAGTGTAGFSGDGGLATSAELTTMGIAVDHLGNLYIADGGSRVRMVNTSGIITTIAGNGIMGFYGDGGLADTAELNFPYAVAVDTLGNLYIADWNNQRIRKVNTSGFISTIAGNGFTGFSGDGGLATAANIANPTDVAVDKNGNVYLSVNTRVRKINPSGVISTVLGNGTGTSGTIYNGLLVSPTISLSTGTPGLAVNKNATLYISNDPDVDTIGANSPVKFINGHSQNITVCPGRTYIDTPLKAVDSNIYQPLFWSVAMAPSHGLLWATCTVSSTGGITTPSLLYYQTSGYAGLDSFKARVFDGFESDTTTIYVNVLPSPNSGIIVGTDTVCIGASVSLTDTVSGGTWSNSNSFSEITTSGIVTGLASGIDTINYTSSNSCGTSQSQHVIFIDSCLSNGISVTNLAATRIYPNPTSGAFEIHISSTINEKVSVLITNISGQIIDEISDVTTNRFALNIDGAPGVYFIDVRTEKECYKSKIVIMK